VIADIVLLKRAEDVVTVAAFEHPRLPPATLKPLDRAIGGDAKCCNRR
jgi:hypothetical protein